MKKDTILVSPDVYSEFIKPNTIDLNNSHSTILEVEEGRGFTYKRDHEVNNRIALTKVLSEAYGRDIETTLITNSGISIATLLASTDYFNKIFYYKSTYPEMIHAFNFLGKAQEFTKMSDVHQNDLVCIESCRIPDGIDQQELIEVLTEQIHERGAYICVDNSCYNFYNYNPFKVGADIVIESLSKLCCGYNTSLLGVILIADHLKEMFSEVRNNCRFYGFHPHPVDCYLTLLGAQTLPLRLEKIQSNTNKIVDYLKANDISYRVNKLGGVIFVKLKDVNNRETFIKDLKVFQKGDSFGTNFSLFSCFDKDYKIRLVIGLEDPEDLIDALSKVIKYLK